MIVGNYDCSLNQEQERRPLSPPLLLNAALAVPTKTAMEEKDMKTPIKRGENFCLQIRCSQVGEKSEINNILLRSIYVYIKEVSNTVKLRSASTCDFIDSDL